MGLYKSLYKYKTDYISIKCNQRQEALLVSWTGNSQTGTNDITSTADVRLQNLRFWQQNFKKKPQNFPIAHAVKSKQQSLFYTERIQKSCEPVICFFIYVTQWLRSKIRGGGTVDSELDPCLRLWAALL